MSGNSGRGTKNLGLMKAIHVGVNPPLNTKILWYNDNTEPYTTGPAKVHYFYNVINSQWEPLYGQGTGSGNFGYMSYASDCKGADFSLELDTEIHTHWALVISDNEIQQNQLIPSLFDGRWTKYCSDESVGGGNYTYIAYADDCDGDNFSTNRIYKVPCSDCELISSAEKIEGSESIIKTYNGDGSFDLEFVNAKPGDKILLDLEMGGEPLIDFRTYCIKVQKGDLSGIVALNLDTTDQGSFYVSGASEPEEKFIDDNDGGSKMLVYLPNNQKIETITGTIRVFVGTEGCCSDNAGGADCIAYRKCFAIITSEEPIDELTVDLFAGKWICNCCCDDSKDDPKVKNIEVQVKSLNDFVKEDKIEQDQKIEANSNNIIKNADNLTLVEQELLLAIQNIDKNYSQQINNLNQQILDLQQVNQDQSDQIEELQNQDIVAIVTPTIEDLIEQNNTEIQSDIQDVQNNLQEFISNTYNVDHAQVVDDIANLNDRIDELEFTPPFYKDLFGDTVTIGSDEHGIPKVSSVFVFDNEKKSVEVDIILVDNDVTIRHNDKLDGYFAIIN